MAKSDKEIDAAYRAKKQAHGLIYKGYWIHHTMIERATRAIARLNKEAVKVDE